MTDVKARVREVLERLPDACSTEDVQYQLYVIQTLAQRNEAADRGDFVQHEEAEARLEKWRVK